MTGLHFASRWVPLACSLLLTPGCGGSSDGDDVSSRNPSADDDADDDGAADDDSPDTRGDDDGSEDASDDDATREDDTASDDETGDDDAANDDDLPEPLTDGPLDLPATDAEALQPPEPLLPDTPPETPVSELPPKDFEALCEPYLEEATGTISGLENLCALAGVNAANESNAATVEEYQRACGEARIQCETDSAAAQVLTDSLECTMPEDCTATVAEVEACYQSLHVLNAAIIEPLGLTEFPACEDLTPTEGGVIAAQVLLYFLTNAVAAGVPTDTTAEEADDPCGALEMTCPGLATPNLDPMME